jgi:hypothetical protein
LFPLKLMVIEEWHVNTSIPIITGATKLSTTRNCTFNFSRASNSEPWKIPLTFNVELSANDTFEVDCVSYENFHCRRSSDVIKVLSDPVSNSACVRFSFMVTLISLSGVSIAVMIVDIIVLSVSSFYSLTTAALV